MAIDQVGQGSILIKGEISKSQLQKKGKEAVDTIQSVASRNPINLRFDIGKSDAFSKLPLGRITNDINAFQGALDASIARTLAFAASAGALTAVTKGMKQIVAASVDVEKQMLDINVLFGLSSDTLKRFEGQLFSVARNTAQSFKDVSTAAAEFARQGLSVEETQKRVNDALILTRLSGLGVAESVSTITAAINGFNSEAITSSEVVNRLANVDAAFAVSSADLAQALARAGAVSQDAKVSFNELAAATTAVQQRTARGGAIIGNGFKSIFTRLQRSGVQEKLEEIGVSTKNLNGEFRGAIPILQDYANIYRNLSDDIRASTDEQIAGVFQINNLKAIVADLSSEYSVFREALDIAAQSSNEAVVRNLELNKSLSAVAQSAATSAYQIASAFGQRVINTEFVKDGISAISDIFQSGAEAFNKQGEEAGASIGTFLVDGLVGVVTGPLAAKVLLALTKITKFLIVESKKVFDQIGSLGGNLSKVSEIQNRLTSFVINEEKAREAISKILNSTDDEVKKVELAEKQILDIIRDQIKSKERLLTLTEAIARKGSLEATVQGTLIPSTSRPKRAAGGYINNLVRDEKRDISKGVGGAKPSDQVVVIPDFNYGGGQKGVMVANTGEYIKRSPLGDSILTNDMVSNVNISGVKKVGRAARGSDDAIKQLIKTIIQGEISSGRGPVTGIGKIDTKGFYEGIQEKLSKIVPNSKGAVQKYLLESRPPQLPLERKIGNTAFAKLTKKDVEDILNPKKAVSKASVDIAKKTQLSSTAMLGLFFAAQSASSALENLSEEGSILSSAGKAASSGLNLGAFATILSQAIPSIAAQAGPIGLVVGGSIAAIKFVSDLTDETEKLQKELNKASEAMIQTTNSIATFSQKQNQYNELLASSDIEKSSKVFRDLVLSANEFGPEFSGKLVNSISRPEETGKIFEEISKIAKDAERSAVIASALYKPKNPTKAGAEIGGLLTGTISRNAFADVSIDNLSDKVNKTFEDIDSIVSSAKDREKSKLFSSENLKTGSRILRFASSKDPFALASLAKNVPKRFAEKNRLNENDFSRASALFTDLAKYAGIQDSLIKKTIESATSTESLNSAIKSLGDGIKKTNLADALAKLQEAINRPAISIRAALIDVEKSLRKDSENRKRNIEESQRVQSAASSILRPITDASNISGYGQSLSRSENISKASEDVESILQGFADTVFTELKANPQNASKIQSQLRPFLERGDIFGIGAYDNQFNSDIPKSIKDSANETAQKLQDVIQEISDSNAYLAAIEVATKAVERFQSAEKRIVSGGVGYNTAFSRAFDVVSNNPTAKNSVIEERARLKAFQTASDAGFLNAEQEKQFQIDKARLGTSARIAELSGIGNNAFLRSNISDLLGGSFGVVSGNKFDATSQVLQDLEDYTNGLTGKTQENISKEVENIRSQVGADLTGPTNIVSTIVGKITKAFSDQVDVVTKVQEEAKRENAKELESLEAERLQLIATMQAMEGFFKDNSSSNLAIDVNYNPEEFRKIIDVNVKKSIRGE